MNKKKYLYLVPRKKFFSEGYRGRVMHALGIAEGLSENGYEVDFVGGNCLKEFENDLPDHINLIVITESKLSFFTRLKFFRSVLTLMKKNQYEAIVIRYAFSSYFLLLFLSFFIKGTKKVIEVNLFAYHYFFLKNSFANNIIVSVENFLIRFYDVTYVVSEAMAKDYKCKKYSDRIICIPNGATSKKITYHSSGVDNANVRLVYFGSLMDYWDYEPIVSAIKNSHNEYGVHFFGSGPSLEYLKSALANCNNVVFHGRFKRDDLGILINPSTDFLFLPPKTLVDMENSGGLSTKAFDYLSMKLPIIAPADGELLKIYEHKRNAILYDRNDWTSFNRAVDELVSDNELRREISENAYSDFIANYSWKSRMKVLIDKVEELS